MASTPQLYGWNIADKAKNTIQSINQLASTVPTLASLNKRGKIYWTDSICTKTSSLILTFNHEIWKSVVVIIFLLGAFIVPCLATFQERGQEILSRYLNKDQQFDLDLWPENQSGTSTLYGRPLYQLWQLSRKGVKRYRADIAWSTYRPTDRCQKICPFLQRGHYKKYIQIIFVKILISNWILLTKNELKQQNNIHMVQYCFFHFLQTKIICLLQICAVSLQENLLHIYSKHFCISPAIIAACL